MGISRTSGRDPGSINSHNWSNSPTNISQEKKQDYNMIFFVLPAKWKSKHPEEEKLCPCCGDSCVNNQVALETKLVHFKARQTL